MVKPKIVLLIFVSGKIVLTGAKVRLALLPNLFYERCWCHWGSFPKHVVQHTLFTTPFRSAKRFTKPFKQFILCLPNSGSLNQTSQSLVAPWSVFALMQYGVQCRSAGASGFCA